MIYQVTDEHGTIFGVFAFKTEFNGQLIYGTSVEDIEKQVEQIYQNNRPIEDETPLPPLIMPIIEPISLTAEQQARFDEYSKIVDITLDDVSFYTDDSKVGTSIGYRFYAQQKETISQGKMVTDLEISEIENGQSLTDLELLMLGGKL